MPVILCLDVLHSHATPRGKGNGQSAKAAVREVVGGADTGAVGSIINGKLCTQPCNRKHTDDNWMGKGKREKR